MKICSFGLFIVSVHDSSNNTAILRVKVVLTKNPWKLKGHEVTCCFFFISSQIVQHLNTFLSKPTSHHKRVYFRLLLITKCFIKIMCLICNSKEMRNLTGKGRCLWTARTLRMEVWHHIGVFFFCNFYGGLKSRRKSAQYYLVAKFLKENPLRPLKYPFLLLLYSFGNKKGLFGIKLFSAACDLGTFYMYVQVSIHRHKCFFLKQAPKRPRKKDNQGLF